MDGHPRRRGGLRVPTGRRVALLLASVPSMPNAAPRDKCQQALGGLATYHLESAACHFCKYSCEILSVHVIFICPVRNRADEVIVIRQSDFFGVSVETSVFTRT